MNRLLQLTLAFLSLSASGPHFASTRVLADEPKAPKEWASYELGEIASVNSMAISPDGMAVAVLTGLPPGKDLRKHGSSVREVSTGKVLTQWKGRVYSSGFTANGKAVVSTTYAGTVTLETLDGESRKFAGLRDDKGDEDLLVNQPAAAVSPDGKLVVSNLFDQVKVWDATTGKERAVLKTGVHTRVLAFSPDGKTLAVGGETELHLWDIEKAESRLLLKGHKGRVTSLAFDATGKTLISGSWDKTARVWDAATGEEKWVLRELTAEVNCVAVAADGKYFAAGGEDGAVKLWDARGKELGSYENRVDRTSASVHLVTFLSEVDDSSFETLGDRLVSLVWGSQHITRPESGTRLDNRVKLWKVTLERTPKK